MARRLLLFSSLVLLLQAACGADSAADSFGSPAKSAGASDGEPSPGAGGAGGAGGLPPEEELESSFLSPVATGKFVWIANPQSGRVAFLDASSFHIQLLEAGHAPTYLAAVPSSDGSDRALVLNTLSLDASLLVARDGALSASTLPVPSSGNTWAISPDGRFAIAWHDAARLKDPDPLDGFQDLTVLDLAASTSTALTVGFRPVSVSYSADLTRAFVVTQDGVAVIALGGSPAVARNIKLADDPTAASTTRDVVISPDGTLALVRREGVASITVVDLEGGVRSEVPLDAPATDLDLAPDGKVAVAVVRDKGQVALLRLPDVATEPKAWKVLQVGSKDNVVGSASMAPKSGVAFLYSNAASNALLTVLDVTQEDPQPKLIQLRAPVGAVFPTADGASAVVVHTKGPQGSSSQYKAALSVVPVAADLPAKIVGLHEPVSSVALSPDGTRAMVAVGDEKSAQWWAVLVRLGTQQVDSHALPSPPIGSGVVAEAGRGYVAQKHPDGRISFLDLESGEMRTLTGFELASQVVYGEKP